MQRLRRLPDVRPSAAVAVVRLGTESRREWGVHQLLVPSLVDLTWTPIVVAVIAAVAPTLAVVWHRRQTRQHSAKLDEIVTLVNGRLARMMGGVEARLRALEAELRRMLP